MKSLKKWFRGILLKRKIKLIGRYMGDVNAMMIASGWRRDRRRAYWRDIVTIIKRFS